MLLRPALALRDGAKVGRGFFFKRYRTMNERGSEVYGWEHSHPYVKLNNFAFFQEHRRESTQNVMQV